MTCTICGRYAESDRETGYDADEMCPDCALIGEICKEKEKVDPIESDLHDLGSVLASLADIVKDCHSKERLFDVTMELARLTRAMQELHDAVYLRLDFDERLK